MAPASPPPFPPPLSTTANG
ncbi:hypothetical protein CCACVL1_05490 [Corchorus capsularis]|uniref:Uncharacterized protein n=1 Tax=Corchorus capsularis TaxID=210143 RepID=A0A1R3JK79_COCAP|nr:hypothetical protein CCACVL1_05490 [Corchorus capsularis]